MATARLSGEEKFIQSLNKFSCTSGILSPSESVAGGLSPSVLLGSVVPTFEIAGN